MAEMTEIEDESDSFSTQNPDSVQEHVPQLDDDFTTEIFKIIVGNLPKVYSIGHLKKFLIKLKLQPKKVKMVPKSDFAFVTFKCNEDRELALSTLNNYTWRNKALTAKLARAKEDPFEKKKQQKQDDKEDMRCEEGGVGVGVNILERIRDVVTPLWNTSYGEQQKIKYEAMSQVLKKLVKELNAVDAGPWVRQNRSKTGGMCCLLEELLPSPVCEAYRNKCEFTIGTGLDGSGKTVGFRLKAYKEGCAAVVEPSNCTHIPQVMKDVVQELQCYVKESALDVYEPSTNRGFWKQLTVRSNLNGDTMCIIEILPGQNTFEHDVGSEVEKITKYFREETKIKLTSLYVEIASRKTESNILRHVLGGKFIFENLCGLKFRISPHAFFQVNTKSAEILYTAIRDCMGDVSSNTIILDVCCGTGTIGLSMAKNVRKVIGVEMCPEAVEDAKFNAQSNGITNVEFHCGKAEDVIVKTTVTLDENKSEVIAVLDPPRAGCHAKVLQAIRRCSSIQKLIYVSCSPSSVMKDFVALCRPKSKRTKGNPFKIVKAVPVDLFPQTRYCELIVVLDR